MGIEVAVGSFETGALVAVLSLTAVFIIAVLLWAIRGPSRLRQGITYAGIVVIAGLVLVVWKGHQDMEKVLDSSSAVEQHYDVSFGGNPRSILFMPEEGEKHVVRFLEGSGQETKGKPAEEFHRGILEITDGRAILKLLVTTDDPKKPEWVEYNENIAKDDAIRKVLQYEEVQGVNEAFGNIVGIE